MCTTRWALKQHTATKCNPQIWYSTSNTSDPRVRSHGWFPEILSFRKLVMMPKLSVHMSNICTRTAPWFILRYVTSPSSSLLNCRLGCVDKSVQTNALCVLWCIADELLIVQSTPQRCQSSTHLVSRTSDYFHKTSHYAASLLSCGILIRCLKYRRFFVTQQLAFCSS